jgi:hypothetical protein
VGSEAPCPSSRSIRTEPRLQQGLYQYQFTHSLLLCAATIFPIILASDQVVLDNADRVTGKIVKKDGDNVAIKTDLPM